MDLKWTATHFQIISFGVLLSSVTSQEVRVLTTKTPNSSRWDFIHLFNSQRSVEKPEFEVDRAWFTINSTLTFDLQLWGQNTQCIGCKLKQLNVLLGPNTSTLLVETRWPMKIKLTTQQSAGAEVIICSFDQHFRESGDYWLFLDSKDYIGGTECDLLLSNDPLPAEIPIAFTLLGLLGLAGLWKIMKCTYRCCRSVGRKSADITDPHDLTTEISVSVVMETLNMPKEEMENGGPRIKISEPKKKQRLRSLDTFRGIAITVMIFVNYGGGGYWFFDHPPWNGLSVADLVFPWFIFIMGTAMNFSFRSMYKRGKTRCQIFLKIFKRSCILFGLGIILATKAGPIDLTKLRIPGVLQRFAFTYFFIAVMELVFHRRGDSHSDAKWAPLRDVILYIPMWILNLAIVGVYLGLTFALPVPNCPTGYIGPGGLSDGGKYYNCTGGAARYIDELILGNNHLYQYPTPKEMYETEVPYDPEGILGILTSVFLCFLGLQAGRIIITYQSHKGRVIRFFIWGVITGAIAALLCKCSQNDGWIPINKNLWSLSFVLLTGSFAFFLLSAMYIFMDVLNWWEGAPFIFPGMNSIVLYCGHSLCYRLFPIVWRIEHIHWKMLLQDVWGVAIWCLIAYFMFRKKFFVAI